jgi:CTP:molybdopterin cytidylyltransferase MocA
MHAVITAGGTVDEPFARTLGTPVKALAPFGTRTLLDVAIEACAQAGIARIAVVGGAEVRAHLRGSEVRIIDAVEDGATNVQRALGAWPGERFVYLTSDLPFATGEGILELLARSEPYALTMGLASVEAFEGAFPGAPPQGVALRGERVVNACAFVLAAEALDPVCGLATRFFEARKSLFALARLLGPALCLRFLCKRLGVADVEAYARRVLGISVGAVRDTDPGLCYDIDTLEEYRYACTRLG